MGPAETPASPGSTRLRPTAVVLMLGGLLAVLWSQFAWVRATNFGGYPTDYEMDPEIVTNQVYAPQMLAALKAMPSVSLVTSVDAMFGATNGIYTHIAESTTLFRGSLWERACSVEPRRA